MTEQEAATDFIRRYEKFWRDGAKNLDSVYLQDAILCGYEIVKSTVNISPLLAGIIAQGWSDISIEIVESSATEHAILLACRYTARGNGEESTAKSSYVLVKEGAVWKAVMHTAT